MKEEYSSLYSFCLLISFLLSLLYLSAFYLCTHTLDSAYLSVTTIPIWSPIYGHTSWILKSSVLPPSKILLHLIFCLFICLSFVLCIRYTANYEGEVTSRANGKRRKGHSEVPGSRIRDHYLRVRPADMECAWQSRWQNAVLLGGAYSFVHPEMLVHQGFPFFPCGTYAITVMCTNITQVK